MEQDDLEAQYAAQAQEEEADRQRKLEPPPNLSREEFLAWRSPRTVSDNPTRLDNPLWHWLVRTRWSAYQANEKLHGPSSIEAGPMWCFDRFGMSKTLLPDGRLVHIGGEHEDHYDPDFHIYNDVTVIDPEGNIAIHAYPRADFPPTDFHSATLVGESIVIIGCLGYREQRMAGTTPVYRLALDTMRISKVEAGGDAPGWIHRHRAALREGSLEIVVTGGEVWRGQDRSMAENIDTWSLNLATGQWSRLTALDWQRWTMRRVDRKPNRLWNVRQELWHRKHAWPGLESYWKFDDEPDFEALAALYTHVDGAPLAQAGPKHNEYRVVIDGVTLRFTEENHLVQAIVEGRLSDDRLLALQCRTLRLLERLDASRWEIEAD